MRAMLKHSGHRWITGAVVMAVTALSILAGGCDSGERQAAPTAPSAPASSAPSDAETPPVVPAPAVTQASWAPDALEELLAPIALYPDQLLTQVLAASVNSQEVLDAGNWLLQNESLKGDELDAAAQKAGFGPAMRALVQFPTVVDMLCQQIDWTRQLGSAFTSDQKGVLDAVQRLRAQAADVGNLKSTPQQTVERKTENDKVIVEVKPADPKVVYVPQYDPQAVYTTPPPPPAPAPTTTTQTGISTGAAVATGLLAFGLGVVVGNAFADDHCYPNWGHGAVYYGPRPFYPPAYVYRPVYGPAFRPAYHYAPPPGYRHSYNNVDVNINRNIVVNNNNYYNRFNNNQNLHVGATQSPLGATRQTSVQNRVGQPAAVNRADNWKGQSTYAGTRNTASAERLNQAAGARPAARSSTAAAADKQIARPSSGTRDLQASRSPHADRGYGESTRTASRDATAKTSAARATNPSLPQRDSATAAAKHDSAFSGAHTQGNGSFERAASARGRASTGGGHHAAAARGGHRQR